MSLIARKLAAAAGLLGAGTAFAQAAPAKVDTGDTAWILVSSALVLLMTPGLAFFYGGMTRAKNTVSTLFQSYVAIGVIGMLWLACGYSLAFSGNVGGFIGNMDWGFLRDVGQTPNADYAATIPHALFMLFQCMFAIITPALMTGAFAERVNFKAWLPLMALWSLAVYVPVAHWVWAPGGWIRALGGLDFAGGMVVHMSAGFSALMLALLFGKRRDFGATTQNYDTGMVFLGTGLLWFGWFGFNAGSALSSGGLAVQAYGTTFFASAAAFVAWMAFDWMRKGKASGIGACIGAVAGLVAITPASGFVTFGSACLIGAAAGFICNFACTFVKEKFQVDDTLDVFACHGVGGTLGTIATGLFATKTVNEAGGNGFFYGETGVLAGNLAGAAAVAVYSMVVTFVLYKIVNAITAVRATDVDESVGLDRSQHGEVAHTSVAHGDAANVKPIRNNHAA